MQLTAYLLGVVAPDDLLSFFCVCARLYVIPLFVC